MMIEDFMLIIYEFNKMDEFFRGKPTIDGVNFNEICEEFKKHFALN